MMLSWRGERSSNLVHLTTLPTGESKPISFNGSIAMVERSTFVDGVLNSKIGTLGAPLHEVRQLPLDLDEAASRWVSPPISVPYGRNKIVATLVYPDEPGALLQADMNLIVRAGDLERHGNMGSGAGFDNTSKFFPCSNTTPPLTLPRQC
jgi:hypothetical protein